MFCHDRQKRIQYEFAMKAVLMKCVETRLEDRDVEY